MFFSFAQTQVFGRADNLQTSLEKIGSRKGKNPVIIIPGILGSELINKETGEQVWFSVRRSKDDDLKLPIALDFKYSHDKLIPSDIMRKLELPIFRDVEIYQGIIDALKDQGNYTEISWDKPPNKVEDTFLVFPYDWRRDNVEKCTSFNQKNESL